MLDYVFFADGSIGPGLLQDESTGARESHGDRVIAYAGAVFMRNEAPHFDGTKPMFKRNTLGDILGHAGVQDGERIADTTGRTCKRDDRPACFAWRRGLDGSDHNGGHDLERYDCGQPDHGC